MTFSASLPRFPLSWSPTWRHESDGAGLPEVRVLMGPDTGAISDALGREREQLLALGQIYVFDDHDAVRELLLAERNLRVALFAAYPRITRVFGAGASLVLRAETDPDEGGGNELLLRIGTGLPVELAMERLGRFDSSWWRMAASRFDQLVIDVD